MTKQIIATFETRRAAEMAVEHLVQEHGITRADIVVDAEGASNSSGTKRSGADAVKSAGDPDGQPKLAGAIRLSVACDASKHDLVNAVLKEAGATLS